MLKKLNIPEVVANSLTDFWELGDFNQVGEITRDLDYTDMVFEISNEKYKIILKSIDEDQIEAFYNKESVGIISFSDFFVFGANCSDITDIICSECEGSGTAESDHQDPQDRLDYECWNCK